MVKRPTMNKPKLEIIQSQPRIYLQPVSRIRRRQPWHKRIAAWWGKNYEAAFNGTGATIAIITVLLLLVVTYFQTGKWLGWW